MSLTLSQWCLGSSLACVFIISKPGLDLEILFLYKAKLQKAIPCSLMIGKVGEPYVYMAFAM